MNFTEEHLKEVEEMAGLFFSPEDIAMEHANLLKAIGEKPQVELPDPKRTEKHEFYIMIQNNSQQVVSLSYQIGSYRIEIIECISNKYEGCWIF